MFVLLAATPVQPPTSSEVDAREVPVLSARARALVAAPDFRRAIELAAGGGVARQFVPRASYMVGTTVGFEWSRWALVLDGRYAGSQSTRMFARARAGVAWICRGTWLCNLMEDGASARPCVHGCSGCRRTGAGSRYQLDPSRYPRVDRHDRHGVDARMDHAAMVRRRSAQMEGPSRAATHRCTNVGRPRHSRLSRSHVGVVRISDGGHGIASAVTSVRPSPTGLFLDAFDFC